MNEIPKNAANYANKVVYFENLTKSKTECEVNKPKKSPSGVTFVRAPQDGVQNIVGARDDLAHESSIDEPRPTQGDDSIDGADALFHDVQDEPNGLPKNGTKEETSDVDFNGNDPKHTKHEDVTYMNRYNALHEAHYAATLCTSIVWCIVVLSFIYLMLMQCLWMLLPVGAPNVTSPTTEIESMTNPSDHLISNAKMEQRIMKTPRLEASHGVRGGGTSLTLMLAEITRLSKAMDDWLAQSGGGELHIICGYEYVFGPPVGSSVNFNITDQCAMYLPEYDFPKQRYFMFNNLRINAKALRKLNNSDEGDQGESPTSPLRTGDFKSVHAFDYWEYCKQDVEKGITAERMNRFLLIFNNHAANAVDRRSDGIPLLSEEIAKMDLLMHPGNDRNQLVSSPASIYALVRFSGDKFSDSKSLRFQMVYNVGDVFFNNNDGDRQFPVSVKLPKHLPFTLNTIEEEQRMLTKWCLK